ncbi:hypothetical protein SAMN02745248_02183 [Hathewaya proteolytica DSM 3090]|uniref:SSD domain-containing protein n=1 Tax=Hathewaya proteolytica DSM 3090 TaxID=1121331 RepID=A0A1M6R361_9CLOT|nr:MMPL family transporter [Hathewaya proteolytica]SHK26768.1 hypothetical protein SAMN02745248_02183 [Hathewaya proteolytica DSM 3090]
MKKKFADFIVKNKILILIISIALLVPSVIGMIATKINYDILSYLPQDLETMKGQSILESEYNLAATGMMTIENMVDKDVKKLCEDIKNVDGVTDVIGARSILDIGVPKEMLPEKFRKICYSDNSTLILIKFTNNAASEKTYEAIENIRKITDKRAFLGGMSAIVHDTRELAEQETPLYVIVAVIFAIAVLAMSLESTIVPFIFLLGIAFPILYNMGTNYFFGEISYITKALAAVLQLGVTMDYSIFLLHRYDEEKKKCGSAEEAMSNAIVSTFSSIIGSSLTTVAGFLALCTMSLALGKDIGLVMAKGVILGVISTVTVLPALLMYFDKLIHKYTHRVLMPEFDKVSDFVVKHNKIIAIVFVVLFIPAIFGQANADVYYNLDESLPKDLPSIVGTNKLKHDYDMTTTHFILINDKVPSYKVNEMIKKIENVDGVKTVLGYDDLMGAMIPEEFIPSQIRDVFKNGGYNMIVANSKYKAAADAENAQIDEIDKIIKSYDTNAFMSGEGPLTKDLIEIADEDFKNVNIASIVAIFVIILFVFKSVSVPVILVLAIELAISINLGIPYYTGTVLPFVASIVVGTIQLGATVDYAILMTNRFKEELNNGLDSSEAMKISIRECSKSIICSALTFFGATIGVAMVSKMELIKSLCSLMARGALISMACIIFVLPALLIIFEKVINKTSIKWRIG